jgi:Sortase domain
MPASRRRLLAGTAGLLLVSGIVLVAAASLTSAGRPPEPPTVNPSGPAARAAVGRPCAGPASASHAGRLPYSVPEEVTIPAICVRASVIPLGLNPDGTVQVPSLSTPQLTSWFDEGPAPGQTGPAAVYGHVDTAATGPAVFYRLGDLVPGDAIDVTSADHRVAVFAVYRIAEYAKTAFPTMTVYGQTPGPELRLITCGGPFDAATGHYLDNIVVFARLVGST